MARVVVRALRDVVRERDGHRCVYCGSDRLLVSDHLIPKVIGGPDLTWNLVTSCTDCNSSRGTAVQEIHLRLLHHNVALAIVTREELT